MRLIKEEKVKDKIHPDYGPVKFSCTCGNVIETHSTTKDQTIEICSACHPFYTGKQKLIDSAGRVEKFKAKYAKMAKLKEKAKAE